MGSRQFFLRVPIGTAAPRLDRVARVASAALLFGISLSISASAQTVTLGQYQHPRTENDLSFNKTYMIGAKDGLIAYNMSAQEKSFCLPGVIPVLTFEQANDLVMRWSRKTSGSADLPLGRALFFALKEAFPCGSSAR